jgi:hypothetical protein
VTNKPDQLDKPRDLGCCPYCGCKLADGFRAELEHHQGGCPNTPIGSPEGMALMAAAIKKQAPGPAQTPADLTDQDDDQCSRCEHLHGVYEGPCFSPLDNGEKCGCPAFVPYPAPAVDLEELERFARATIRNCDAPSPSSLPCYLSTRGACQYILALITELRANKRTAACGGTWSPPGSADTFVCALSDDHDDINCQSGSHSWPHWQSRWSGRAAADAKRLDALARQVGYLSASVSNLIEQAAKKARQP